MIIAAIPTSAQAPAIIFVLLFISSPFLQQNKTKFDTTNQVKILLVCTSILYKILCVSVNRINKIKFISLKDNIKCFGFL